MPDAERPPRRRPTPRERPLSAELISDLHARRRWFADSARRHTPLSSEYLARDWYDREARCWAEAEIGVDAAFAWRELGLRPQEAAELQREGFEPEEVNRLWRDSGIPGTEIADWIGAGLTPDEALSMRAAGTTAEDAAVMRRLRHLGDV